MTPPSRVRGFRRVLGALATPLALGLPITLSAQTGYSVTIGVRQVAGDNVYLDIGSLQGLASGDTIDVFRADGGDRLGRAVVVATSESRSVLGILDPAFLVEPGTALTLGVLREPVAAAPTNAVPHQEDLPPRPPAAPPAEARDDAELRPSAYGRIGIDLAGSHSSTRIGGSDPIDVDRTFATPALRLDVTVPQAIGGFDLRTSARLAYRYSDKNEIQPEGSTRFYALSLRRTFTSAPLQLEIGRFRSRFEPFSGYTDGVAVRYGDRPLGAGFVVGLEPDRGNEGASLERPKAVVFVDVERRGASWSWVGDASAHFVSGTEGERERRFVGLSQRMSWRELELNHDLQFDQDPEGGNASLSFLRVQGAVGLWSDLQARAGFTLRRAGQQGGVEAEPSPESERLLVGLSHRGDAVTWGVDVSRATSRLGPESTGYHAHLSLDDALPIPGSARIAGSYWEGAEGEAFSVGPTLTGSRGDALVSVGYRLYRADYLSRETMQHGADVTADFSLANGLRASIQLRTDLSDTLRSEQIRLQLYRRF